MQLTHKGKINLIRIVAGIIIILILIMVFSSFGIDGFRLIWFFIIPAAAYYNMKQKIYKQLEGTAYTQLGFTKQATYDLSKFMVTKQGKLEIDMVESGKFNEKNITMLDFSITVGSGKHSYTYDFIGAVLSTPSNIVPMQFYDKDNPLKWQSGAGNIVKLEYPEFNNQFKVYTQNPQDAFYDLAPDTMAKLLDLRKELGQQINIEYMPGEILIYSDMKKFVKKLNKALSFTEVLNGEPNGTDVIIYKDTISTLIKISEAVFSTLDVK